MVTANNKRIFESRNEFVQFSMEWLEYCLRDKFSELDVDNFYNGDCYIEDTEEWDEVKGEFFDMFNHGSVNYDLDELGTISELREMFATKEYDIEITCPGITPEQMESLKSKFLEGALVCLRRELENYMSPENVDKFMDYGINPDNNPEPNKLEDFGICVAMASWISVKMSLYHPELCILSTENVQDFKEFIDTNFETLFL